jgi:hypothetical protein
MGRAFVSLRAVPLGFDPHRVVTANVVQLAFFDIMMLHDGYW